MLRYRAKVEEEAIIIQIADLFYHKHFSKVLLNVLTSKRVTSNELA